MEGSKLLITGKPIYVDGEYHPGEIDWGPEGDDDIEERRARSGPWTTSCARSATTTCAAIGGDVHNYQRYPVEVIDETKPPCDEDAEDPPTRTIEYVVSGAAGAYLSATHRFGKVDLKPEFDGQPIPVKPVTEENFWCYPLRGDSLARFVRRSSVGFFLLLVAAMLIVAGAVYAFFYPLEGGELTVGKFDNEIWEAMIMVPVAVIAAGVALQVGRGVSRAVVPFGYQTMTATILTTSIGALLVGGAIAVFDDWALIWKMSLATIGGIAVPAAGLVGYFLVRDFVAPSVRLALALSIPLAIAIVCVPFESVAFEVAAAALALWMAIWGLSWLRGKGAAEATKRVRASRIVPAALTVAGLVVILLSVREDSWIPVALAIALGTIVSLLALGLLLIGLRGIVALPWLIPGRVDPDETARWLASRLKMDPVRPSAKNAEVSLGTKALASFLYKTPKLNGFISEVAEATSPPFFKNFLRLDIAGSELRITAYGVSGLAADESSPTIEDVVPVSLTANRPDAPAQSSAPAT